MGDDIAADGRARSAPGKWKVLVVDDDPTVIAVTHIILRNFSFENRSLELIDAHSAAEAKKIIVDNPDIAVILLDVVMEEDDSGLKVARYIREELANKLVRIILRTGQPGRAPEKQVIVEYDINDYKLKTELTADKLFVTMVAALRSYGDLMIMEHNRIGLEKIVESSATLFRLQDYREFISGVLIQMTSLMRLEKNALYCRASGLSAQRRGDGFVIEAAVGDYSGFVNEPIERALDAAGLELVRRAVGEKRSVYLPNGLISYFESASGLESIIYAISTRDLDQWDRKLMELFCANVGVGLDNIALGREIESTQKEVIETLGEVAEARSMETSHHVKRVAEYSTLLATLAGLEEVEVEILRLAVPMHDLGKLAVPDSVLNKPGPLDAEEMGVIRTHARAGFDMLKSSTREIMRTAALIALEHHERYDGSGYPLGKQGEAISIQGRIVAIADVYDALGRERVYKKAWDPVEILDYFRRERGAAFDPALTDLFIGHFGEMEAIRARFAG
jgi:response regulator RpfG family c-di-GMP phosphodiesterase